MSSKGAVFVTTMSFTSALLRPQRPQAETILSFICFNLSAILAIAPLFENLTPKGTSCADYRAKISIPGGLCQ